MMIMKMTCPERTRARFVHANRLKQARRVRGEGAAVVSRARADAPVVELQSSTFGPFWLQDLALAWRKIAKVNAQVVEGC